MCVIDSPIIFNTYFPALLLRVVQKFVQLILYSHCALLKPYQNYIGIFYVQFAIITILCLLSIYTSTFSNIKKNTIILSKKFKKMREFA